jgi:hypothetical protein
LQNICDQRLFACELPGHLHAASAGLSRGSCGDQGRPRSEFWCARSRNVSRPQPRSLPGTPNRVGTKNSPPSWLDDPVAATRLTSSDVAAVIGYLELLCPRRLFPAAWVTAPILLGQDPRSELPLRAGAAVSDEPRGRQPARSTPVCAQEIPARAYRARMRALKGTVEPRSIRARHVAELDRPLSGRCMHKGVNERSGDEPWTSLLNRPAP